MNYQIKNCSLQDADAYAKHCMIHLKEKGIGNIYVHPYPLNHAWNEDEFLANLSEKWGSEPFSPNWEIAWIAIVDNKIVGHLCLRCGGIASQKHRMRLGMGLEKEYRSKGIGKALITHAITWARLQKQIAWIDLSVFSQNLVAKQMYESMGFKSTHVIEDALRIDNESIDDIQMVLALN